MVTKVEIELVIGGPAKWGLGILDKLCKVGLEWGLDWGLWVHFGCEFHCFVNSPALVAIGAWDGCGGECCGGLDPWGGVGKDGGLGKGVGGMGN